MRASTLIFIAGGLNLVACLASIAGGNHTPYAYVFLGTSVIMIGCGFMVRSKGK